MTGPLPKHPSVRNRRNRTAGSTGRVLASVPDVKVPDWPLSPDAMLAATRENLRDRVAADQHAVESETDRRKLYRLRRQLDKNEIALTILDLQIEQAADTEKAIWADLWGTPQAAIWAENPASVREVALYVRWMARAEQGDLRAASEARQLSNALGINPAALLKLRAEIENVDAIEDRGRRRRERVRPPSQSGNDPRAGLHAV